MRVIFLPAALVATMAVAGCINREDKIPFDGQYFRSKVSKVDKQFDVFTVSVKPVSASLEGAREAGRYEATSYCVNTFGSSDIIWTAGPDAPEEDLTIENDQLVLQGRCPQI